MPGAEVNPTFWREEKELISLSWCEVNRIDILIEKGMNAHESVLIPFFIQSSLQYLPKYT